MSTIADRIIEIVNEKTGGNMSEFARQIEVSPTYISKFKTCHDRTPSDRVVRDICNVFGVNRAWLETGEGEPFLPMNKEETLKSVFSDVLSGKSSEKNDFIAAIAELPDELVGPMVQSWIKAAEIMKERLEQK